MAARSSIAVAAVFLAIMAVVVPAALAQASGPVATLSGPPNITAILEKGEQYTTFIRLMKETQQDTQLNSQLNNSFNGNGYTVFAPTDNAFNNLSPAHSTASRSSSRSRSSRATSSRKSQLYSMDSFQTASNPVRTQACGTDGPYTLNITADKFFVESTNKR